jgi:hypothetical protein
MTPTMSDLHVQSGAVIALRLFDVAYSVDLKRVEEIWSARFPESAVRSTLHSTPAKALTFGVPPVLVRLDPIRILIHGAEHSCDVRARIYEFGVVSLAIKVPVSEMEWKDYTDFANAIDRDIGPSSRTPWDDILSKLRGIIDPAMKRPNGMMMEEDHLISIVQSWNRPVTGEALAENVDLVPLLSGENRPLAEKTRQDLLKRRFSYYEDDLVVVTWDRAFIYEPRNDSDVADIIEVANAQLLEFRYYDELLDEELPRMYQLVKEARHAANIFSPRRFADLARNLHTLVAEVTELTEKADNVLQVTEDVYLARIYRATLETLGVSTIAEAVERKLSIVRNTYASLHEEASGLRGELLEISIVLLIILEIIIALIGNRA